MHGQKNITLVQYSPGQNEGNIKKIRIQVKSTEIPTRYLATQFHYSSLHPEDRSNSVSLKVRHIDRRRKQFTAGKISTLQHSVGIC